VLFAQVGRQWISLMRDFWRRRPGRNGNRADVDMFFYTFSGLRKSTVSYCRQNTEVLAQIDGKA